MRAEGEIGLENFYIVQTTLVVTDRKQRHGEKRGLPQIAMPVQNPENLSAPCSSPCSSVLISRRNLLEEGYRIKYFCLPFT